MGQSSHRLDRAVPSYHANVVRPRRLAPISCIQTPTSSRIVDSWLFSFPYSPASLLFLLNPTSAISRALIRVDVQILPSLISIFLPHRSAYRRLMRHQQHGVSAAVDEQQLNSLVRRLIRKFQWARQQENHRVVDEIRARAMATRCLCPPDSSLGRCFGRRFSMPKSPPTPPLPYRLLPSSSNGMMMFSSAVRRWESG